MRDRPKGGMRQKDKKGETKEKSLPKRGQRTEKNKGDCKY